MARSPRTPTAQDLALAPSCAELEIGLPIAWPDGSPMRITLRALTARQRMAANRAAVKAALEWGGEFDDDVWAVKTAFYGIARPQLTEAQESILWDMNAWIRDQIVDAIDTLQRIPAAAVETELERLAGTAVPPAPPKKKPGRQRPEPDPVDRGAGPADQSDGGPGSAGPG